MKKLNIAVLTVLLVFQTFLMPLGTAGVTFAETNTIAEESNTELATGSNESNELLDSVVNEETSTSDDSILEDQDLEFNTIENALATTSIATETENTSNTTSQEGSGENNSIACTIPKEIQTKLTHFKLTLDGKEVTNSNLELPKVANGTAEFKFAASTEDCPIAGAYFEFELPNSIVEYTNNTFSQTKTNTEGVKYSYTYDSTNNKVKVTLDEISPAGVSTNAEFSFEFLAGLDQGKLNSSTGLEQKIVIPKANGGNEIIPVTILPSNTGGNLSKEVTSGNLATINADGTRTMEWKVVVNKGGRNLNDAKVTDTMTDGHKLQGKITVKTLEINLNGTFNDKGTNSYDSFEEITLSGRNAFEITYKTVVVLPEKDKVDSKTFKNSVSVKEGNTTIFGPVSKSAKTTYGKPLAKAKNTSKTNNNYESNWYIDFNFNQANLTSGDAWVRDIISGPHKIDPSTIEVYEVNVKEDGTFGGLVSPGNPVSNYSTELGSNVTLHDNKNLVDTFKINFTSDFNKAYRIYYTAIYPDDFYTNQNGELVTNKVTSGNVSANIDSSHWIEEGIGEKTKKIDFENKIITWQIKIKSDSGKPINGFTIRDTFTGEHTLIDKNDDGQITEDDFKVENVSNANFGGIDPSKGFTMTGNVDAGQQAVIEYQTKFAISAEGEPLSSTYANKAEINWADYTIYEHESYTPDATAPTTLNGSKKGSYNYQTQEFDWTIVVNTNKVNINGAVLTDTIGPGHEITGPITVNDYTLKNPNDDTTGTVGPELNSGYTLNPTNPKSDTFTLTFDNNLGPANNKTYIIQYKTKDSDNIMGIDSQTVGANPDYTNEASFQVGSRTTDLGKVEIPVNFGNSILVKNEPTDLNSPIINWILDVNKSHSSLGATTLTDIPSGYLKLIEGSIELRQYNVSSSGISNGSSWVKAESVPGVTVNYLANGGFELKFDDLSKKGYEVKYSTLVLGQKDNNDGTVEENEKFSNYATLQFEGAENLAANQQTASDSNKSWKFQYSSSDSDFSTTKGNLSFVKKGVDPTTGQKVNLEGAEFELVKRINNIDYVFAKATSDENGFFEFKNVNYGKFDVKETKTPTGYKPINKFSVKLSVNNDTALTSNENLAPYEVVNTKNVTLACTQFTITIKDVDGQLLANSPVKLVDANGTELSYTTDVNGQVKLPNTVTAGEYKVVTNTGTASEKELGKVTVQFGSNCNAEVQPAPTCSLFTVTLNEKDANDNTTPRANVTVTVKDAQNNTIATVTTDVNGKFTLPSATTKAGEYSVYEGNQFLGNVIVSYKTLCEAELVQAPTCLTFTLTVKDADGGLASLTDVTIKKADGSILLSTKTNSSGEVTLSSLKPEIYTVVDANGEKLGTFTTNTDCEAEVKPAPTCPHFTITVKDADDNIRPNVSITVKDKNGLVIIKDVKTNQNGEVMIPNTTLPGKYDVYEGDLFIDEINVSYLVDCKDEVQAAPACPDFELTIKNAYGTPLSNLLITIKDSNGDTVKITDNGETKEVFTTDTSGKVIFDESGLFKQDTYTVYAGTSVIGKFTVKEQCKAEVRSPAPPSTGGGGSTPPPVTPVDPETDPEEPTTPTDPETNPEEPTTPTDPETDPEEPTTPTEPETNPEEPTTPTNPGRPVKPTPNPTPGNNGGNTGSTLTPSPGTGTNTGTNVTPPANNVKIPPKVEYIVNKWYNTISNYPQSNVTQQAKQDLLTLVDEYENMTESERKALEKVVDINKVYDILIAEGLLTKRPTFLPQTDGSMNEAWTYIGLMLVLVSAFFLVRRRQA